MKKIFKQRFERTYQIITMMFFSVLITQSGFAQNPFSWAGEADTLFSPRVYQKPAIDPKVESFVSILDLCDEKVDVYVQLIVNPGYDKIKKQAINVDQLEIVPLNSKSGKTILPVVNNKVEFELYDFELTKNAIELEVNALDNKGQSIKKYNVRKERSADGDIEVTESFFAQIFDMGHDGRISNPKGFNDVFTYFCGKYVSKVQLLAFFQDFLGLSPEDICRIKEIIRIKQIKYDDHQIILWDNKYCELLYEFWDDYVNGGPGDESDCKCKVIKSRTFVDHSVGGATGSPLESCPDVSVTEDHLSWNHNQTGVFKTENENWVDILWGYMGASKSIYAHTHHWEGGDEGTNMEKTLINGKLKSGLQFSMKCYDPYNLEIDLECPCEKEVLVSSQYISQALGAAGTDGNILGAGNGEVRSCMQDAAFFTRFSRGTFEMLDLGLADVCVSCRSVDTTNILTNIGEFAGGIESIVPPLLAGTGSVLTQIDDYFAAAGEVVDLFEDLFTFAPDCGIYRDTIYYLVNTTDTHILTPDDDYVSYVISSTVKSKTDFVNDEAFSDLQVISDYSIAGGLKSVVSSDTCCNERVGSYAIGTLSEFLSDNLGQSKFNDMFKNAPLGLARLQRDVALLFTAIDADFLKDVFGLDCGPGCQPDVNCYFNCGYWGDCHEEADPLGGGEGNQIGSAPSFDNLLESEIGGVSFKPTDTTDEFNIYPNPVGDSEELIVERSSANKELATIHIFDLTGRLIYEDHFEDNELVKRINPSFLTTGVNIITIKESDNFYFKRIVK